MWSAQRIAELTDGELIQSSHERQIAGFSIDSRTLKHNECFVAIPGQNVDGHSFLPDAYERGASAALIERDVEYSENFVNLVKVENSLEALQEIAKDHRSQLAVPVIGVTGSSGKTTTKELLHHIISDNHRAFRSPGNYNSEVGLPLALLQMPADAQIGIFELALQHSGDIELLSQLALPSHGLITSIGEAHAGNFSSTDEIADEKWKLALSLSPTGVLCVNADSGYLAERAASLQGPEIKSFGIESSAAQFRAVDINDRELNGLKFRILSPFAEVEITAKLLGRSGCYAILGSAAMAMSLGIPPEQIERRVQTFEPMEGRMQLLPSARLGQLIHDAYNANPASMRDAINSLDRLVTPLNKAVVIGDMLELGCKSEEAHSALGRLIATTRIQHVFTIGKAARGIYSELEKDSSWRGQATHSANVDELIEVIASSLSGSEHLLLVKASRGMALEKVVEALR